MHLDRWHVVAATRRNDLVSADGKDESMSLDLVNVAHFTYNAS
jgi:hypothetical protein